jgi:hypothetical protein
MSQEIVAQEKDREISMSPQFMNGTTIGWTEKWLPPLKHNGIRTVLEDPPAHSLPACGRQGVEQRFVRHTKGTPTFIFLSPAREKRARILSRKRDQMDFVAL